MTVLYPKSQPIGKKVWALGKQYISVEAPVDICAGCAAEQTRADKYKRAGREKLCQALPDCYNCVWEEV
jgi:hypothetical protein